MICIREENRRMALFDYEEYSGELPQYLGEPGITRPCVKAMATILLGNIKPEWITLVCCHEYPDDNSDSVLFIVWGWISRCGLTIVPDGFGTHGGEGGAGLATVLALIKHTEVPLLQSRVNKERFDALAEGRVDEAALAHLKRAKRYNWGYYPVETIDSRVIGGVEYIEVDYWNFTRVIPR
jgi:hypothetical protein